MLSFSLALFQYNLESVSESALQKPSMDKVPCLLIDEKKRERRRGEREERRADNLRWRGEEDVNWRRGARDVNWRGEVTRVRGGEEMNLRREMSWSRERGVITDRRSELEKKDERFSERLHSGVPGGQDLVYSFQIVSSCRSDADRLKVILSGGHEPGRHHQAEQAQRRQGRRRNGGLVDLALRAPSDLSTGFLI